MRGWIMGAALLLGLAQGAANAADAPPQRSERHSAPVRDTGEHPAAEPQRDPDAVPDRQRAQDQDKDRDAATRRIPADRDTHPGAAQPATSPAGSTPTPAQPVFIISCNASGCNDNQGNFLTRSGPQRLVGPKGISCQLMGNNWQCSPASQP